MSQEFEDEIQQGLFSDKILKFYKLYKIYIYIIIFLFVLIPVSYQLKIYFNMTNYEEEMKKYSIALLNINNNQAKSIDMFKKLAFSKNNIVSSLSINKILENHKISKKEKIIIINSLLEKNKLPPVNTDILKIKKVLLNFDEITEEKILNLLNQKNTNINYKNINFKLLQDFYLSKNQLKKASEFKKF